MEKKRVAIVDSETSFRIYLSEYLFERGYEVDVFAFEPDLLAWITPATNVVIVAETSPAAIAGTGLMGALRDSGCRQPFIAMTGSGSIGDAVDAIRGGAAEYLEKPFDPAILLEKLDRCFLALAAASGTAALRTLVQARLHSLSRRETQVLEGLVNGNSNRATAQVLGISPRTVEVYRSNIMSKMAVASLPELVRLAILAEPGGPDARAA